jgi:hypothetical protein
MLHDQFRYLPVNVTAQICISHGLSNLCQSGFVGRAACESGAEMKCTVAGGISRSIPSWPASEAERLNMIIDADVKRNY